MPEPRRNLLRFNGVSRSFGSFDVLRNVGFELNSGQKVGLIGANGSGKTTLLRLVENPAEADSGAVARASDLRAGRLEQIPDFDRAPVFDLALAPFADLGRMETQLADLEHAIADQPEDAALLERYSDLQHRFEFQGGYTYRARTEAALTGLGFSRDQFSQPASSLSGGEKNRLALARLLLSEAELLLLDEPTNHLDIRAIEWLEHFLKETDKALLIVSHDRFFLDRVVTRVLELDRGRLAEYKGNYTAYVKQREERLALEEKEYARQREWIERTEDYIRRNIAGQKTRQAQSRRKALERVTPLEKPRSSSERVRFRFLPPNRTGRYVLGARDFAVGYPEKTIVEGLDIQVERGERWAILGPNGSGKTTLLRSLVGRQPPLAGELSWDAKLEVGYYDQQLDDLDPGATVLEELRAMDRTASDGDLRSFLAGFLFREDTVFKQVAQLSGGEKSRLTLARIIYAAPTLLALDEPTNHLDIPSREALEEALEAYPATILMVTHDRRLVERIASHILYLGSEGARTFDRFDAFEQWLEHDVEDAPVPAPETRPKPTRRKESAPLSKNRRDQIEKEVEAIERQIEENERALGEIEKLFQAPPPDIEWEAVHQRYAELKAQVEGLYRDLARREERIAD